MPLRLVVAAHDPEGEKRLPVLEHHTRNQRMKWPLTRRDHIGVSRIERKERTTIVENNTGIAGDEARAKTFEQAIDERNRVVVFIDYGEINGITILPEART